MRVLLVEDEPYLAEGITAAITWTKDQAVHVIIDKQAATGDKSSKVAPRRGRNRTVPPA